MIKQTHKFNREWSRGSHNTIEVSVTPIDQHHQIVTCARFLDVYKCTTPLSGIQSVGQQMLRYPRLTTKLGELSHMLHIARDRQTDEHMRVSAAIQAFIIGCNLLRLCRRVIPPWAHELPEIIESNGQLREVGVSHADLAAYLGTAQDNLSSRQHEAIEQCFRAVLNPQLSRIGRYRGPGMEYVLLKRRITNEKDRLLVMWDDEIRLLCSDLSNPERKRRQLSLILARTTPAALRLIEELVERITGHSEAQLIPDTIHQIEDYPYIGKRFFSTSTLDLHPHRHGVDNKERTSIATAIYQERAHMACNIETMLIREGLELGWNTVTSSPSVASMRDVLGIILNGVTQLSFSALRVALRYAYITTTGVSSLERLFHQDQSQYTGDVWIYSIGGDEDVPPMIEGYVLDMLLKLRQLERLFRAGKIRFVPELWCVATFHSQAGENSYTKAGRPLDPARHTYHARLMIERLHAFVTTFFPDVAHRCRWVEFPSYTPTGSARTLFAAVWQRWPERTMLAARFAAFRGGVYDSTRDRIAALFAASDGESGTYPVRHVFSNGLAAHYRGASLRLLRWGSMNTEPIFWTVARMAYMEMLQNPTALRADIISAYTTRGTPEERITLPQLLREITFQQSQMSKACELQGQIGIAAPALYYRRTGEPTPGELATGGIALLTQLAAEAQKDRQRSLQQMCVLYQRLEELPGDQTYSSFLAKWAAQSYSGYIPSDVIASQLERTRSYIIRDATARSMLNFWLS